MFVHFLTDYVGEANVTVSSEFRAWKNGAVLKTVNKTDIPIREAVTSLWNFSTKAIVDETKVNSLNDIFITFRFDVMDKDVGVRSGDGHVFLTSLKDVDLQDSGIQILSITQISLPSEFQSNRVDSVMAAARISLQAKAVSPFTFLETSIAGYFSENGFLLLPDVPLEVDFYGWQSFSASDLKKSLRVRSVFDTY